MFTVFISMLASLLKHPRTTTTNNPGVDYPTVDSDHVSKRTRLLGISDEVSYFFFNVFLFEKFQGCGILLVMLM